MRYALLEDAGRLGDAGCLEAQAGLRGQVDDEGVDGQAATYASQRGRQGVRNGRVDGDGITGALTVRAGPRRSSTLTFRCERLRGVLDCHAHILGSKQANDNRRGEDAYRVT